jgi:hypothetical protein
VNGQVVRVSTNDSWHEPMHLQFDSETMPDWFGDMALDDPRLPACFNIDYVRGWQRVPLRHSQAPSASNLSEYPNGLHGFLHLIAGT